MSYFEQKLGDLKVSVGAGVVKRNQTAAEETLELETLRLRDRQDFSGRGSVSPFVLGVNVGSVLEEQLNDADSVVSGSQVQRRGLLKRREPVSADADGLWLAEGALPSMEQAAD